MLRSRREANRGATLMTRKLPLHVERSHAAHRNIRQNASAPYPPCSRKRSALKPSGTS